MKFKPIRQKKLSEEIADQIQDLILKGEIKPGEMLPPERELADTFGVSRPPVREAINALAAKGLVEKHHGEGTLVKSLVSASMGDPFSQLIIRSKEKVMELMEVRRGIESWTAYLAAERRTPEDVAELQALLNSMENEWQTGRTSESADSRLHIKIAESTHNVIWLHIMHTVFDVLEEFLNLIWQEVYLTTEDRELLFRQHSAVVKAIVGGRAEDAYQHMIEHLSFAERRTLEYLSNHPIDNLVPTPG